MLINVSNSLVEKPQEKQQHNERNIIWAVIWASGRRQRVKCLKISKAVVKCWLSRWTAPFATHKMTCLAITASNAGLEPNYADALVHKDWVGLWCQTLIPVCSSQPWPPSFSFLLQEALLNQRTIHFEPPPSHSSSSLPPSFSFPCSPLLLSHFIAFMLTSSRAVNAPLQGASSWRSP